MKISLFQGILLGVFALGAAVGLFVFATYTSNSTEESIGTVVVWGTLPKKSMESALVTATQSSQELKDVKYAQKDSVTLASELATAIATGGAPDLVLASQEELLSLAKFIVPISRETLPESTFRSAFIDGARILGAPSGYYGIPFLVDPLILFYNRSTLSSAGVARPPATWEALTGLVPTIATLTPSRQITRSLIALGTYANVQNARAILSTLFLQTNVPIAGYSAGGLLAADLGNQFVNGSSPGQAVLRFYTQFADSAKSSYTWNASLPNSRQSFQVGDVALYLGYVSEARYLREANPNLNFDVSPVPQRATAATKTAYGRIYSLMISRGARNPAGAYQVAALLSNSDKQGVAAAATGLAPVNTATLGNAPSDPVAAVAWGGALYTRGWLSPAPVDTDAVFSGMISNVISGRLTPQSALSTAENTLNALLQR